MGFFRLPSEAGKPSLCESETKPYSWGIESESQGRHPPALPILAALPFSIAKTRFAAPRPVPFRFPIPLRCFP
jgi:hypothetical protein